MRRQGRRISLISEVEAKAKAEVKAEVEVEVEVEVENSPRITQISSF